jgi:MOB kinase activator 1
MASFLTTMFVPFSSSPITSPKPLKPHCTLKQSASCVTINTYTLFETPASPTLALSSNKSPKTPSRAVEILRDKWGDLSNFKSSPHSDRESSPFSNARTRGQFKPSQRAGKGNTAFQLKQFAEATLGTGSLRKVVKLPEGEDLNEWLAVNGMKRLSPLTLGESY